MIVLRKQSKKAGRLSVTISAQVSKTNGPAQFPSVKMEQERQWPQVWRKEAAVPWRCNSGEAAVPRRKEKEKRRVSNIGMTRNAWTNAAHQAWAAGELAPLHAEKKKPLVIPVAPKLRCALKPLVIPIAPQHRCLRPPMWEEEALTKEQLRALKEDDALISKQVGCVLRYNTKHFHLQQDDKGFVRVEELLRLPQFACVSPEDLEEIVRNSIGKHGPRFEIVGSAIRALYKQDFGKPGVKKRKRLQRRDTTPRLQKGIDNHDIAALYGDFRNTDTGEYGEPRRHPSRKKRKAHNTACDDSAAAPAGDSNAAAAAPAGSACDDSNAAAAAPAEDYDERSWWLFIPKGPPMSLGPSWHSGSSSKHLGGAGCNRKVGKPLIETKNEPLIEAVSCDCL